MKLFDPQYSLNKLLRPSQNSCTYTELRLCTRWLYLVIRWTFDHSAIIRQLLKATGCTQRKGGWILLHTALFSSLSSKLKSCIIFLSSTIVCHFVLAFPIKFQYVYICGDSLLCPMLAMWMCLISVIHISEMSACLTWNYRNNIWFQHPFLKALLKKLRISMSWDRCIQKRIKVAPKRLAINRCRHCKVCDTVKESGLLSAWAPWRKNNLRCSALDKCLTKLSPTEYISVEMKLEQRNGCLFLSKKHVKVRVQTCWA